MIETANNEIRTNDKDRPLHDNGPQTSLSVENLKLSVTVVNFVKSTNNHMTPPINLPTGFG